MDSRYFSGALMGLVLAVAGCSTSTPLAPTAATTVASSAADGAQAPAKSAVKAVVVDPLDDPKSPLAARSVYFDFDSYVVRAADGAILDNHGKYMTGHPTASLRLEGNADERGGREYNLALGQKRAEAALKALRLLGVPEARMEAVSFGKEKPVALGHDEEAWAKNRRADLNYKAR